MNNICPNKLPKFFKNVVSCNKQKFVTRTNFELHKSFAPIWKWQLKCRIQIMGNGVDLNKQDKENKLAIEIQNAV